MKKNIFLLLVLSLLLQSCSNIDDLRFCPFSSWTIMYIYMAFVASICNYNIIYIFWSSISLPFNSVLAFCMIRFAGWTLAPFVGDYLEQNTHFLNTDFLRFLCGFVGTVIVTHLINRKYGVSLEMKLYESTYFHKVLDKGFNCFTWGMVIYFMYLTAKSYGL